MTDMNIVTVTELPPRPAGRGRPKSRERVALELAAPSQPGVWKGLDLGDVDHARRLAAAMKKMPGHSSAVRGTVIYVRKEPAAPLWESDF
jgi:hypothetical protein